MLMTTMNRFQAQHLLDVATALRQADRKNFTMAVVSRFDWAKYNLFRGRSAKMIERECGTPACALGNYAARTDLQSVFVLDSKGDQIILRATNRRIDLFGYVTQEHFGVSHFEMKELFNTNGCKQAKTPVQAARYIEKFLSNRGWIAA